MYELSEYLIKIFSNPDAYKFEEIIDNVLKYFNEYKEIRDKISKDDILNDTKINSLLVTNDKVFKNVNPLSN